MVGGSVCLHVNTQAFRERIDSLLQTTPYYYHVSCKMQFRCPTRLVVTRWTSVVLCLPRHELCKHRFFLQLRFGTFMCFHSRLLVVHRRMNVRSLTFISMTSSILKLQ